MAEIYDSMSAIETPGVCVSLYPSVHVASLRHFVSSSDFSDTAQSLLGIPLPDRLCATCASQHTLTNRATLAWYSPTETILLCDDAAFITELQAAVTGLDDGCVVDQTGGAWVLRMTGEAVAELFARMGGQGTLPIFGESRRSRLAEVPVLALQVQYGEIILVVERVYAEHLMAWIRASAADPMIS